MIVNDDEMEMPANQEYNKYIQQRTNNSPEFIDTPFSQDGKRKDPVYLASLASHTASTTTTAAAPAAAQQLTATAGIEDNEQLKRQFFEEFLQQQQISEQQFEQQQQQQQQPEEELEPEPRRIVDIQAMAMMIPSGCGMPLESGPRLIKRPDLIPIQKCTMWT